MAIANLPYLLNRITSRRPGMHTSLLTLAALCSIAAAVATVCLLPGNTNPAQEPAPPPGLSPMALPAASAIGPGAGIYVEYADGSGGMGCTAGFLVRTGTGQAGVLTAGHCNRRGQASKVTMNLAGILPYTMFGTFGQTRGTPESMAWSSSVIEGFTS